ncbi:hypothetical protein [Candidatus Rariloculus sp.]|uniref:hypothetical protein n=1 Tax=Candidatus Rariloculus sp. TaxID=3101265 RepID=UPI003D0E5375
MKITIDEDRALPGSELLIAEVNRELAADEPDFIKVSELLKRIIPPRELDPRVAAKSQTVASFLSGTNKSRKLPPKQWAFLD